MHHFASTVFQPKADHFQSPGILCLSAFNIFHGIFYTWIARNSLRVVYLHHPISSLYLSPASHTPISHLVHQCDTNDFQGFFVKVTIFFLNHFPNFFFVPRKSISLKSLTSSSHSTVIRGDMKPPKMVSDLSKAAVRATFRPKNRLAYPRSTSCPVTGGGGKHVRQQ